MSVRHASRYFLQWCSIRRQPAVTTDGEPTTAATPVVTAVRCRIEVPRRQVRTIDQTEVRISPRYLVPFDTGVAVGDAIAPSMTPAAGDYRAIVAVGEQYDHRGALDHLSLEVEP